MRWLLLLLCLMPVSSFAQLETDIDSPTEDVLTEAFVSEEVMMDDLLGMLARFSTYIINDYEECTTPNSQGERCGCFKGESTMNSNEAGVRTNADLSMICAFLVKYAQPKNIPLPSGVTYEMLKKYAMTSLTFAYSTHKANKLKTCADGRYWGSVSVKDKVWESSLWAMSVAYSAFFQWNDLTAKQREYIRRLLLAECQYELQRTIPTGFRGDTKAEENGWEADVLAVTLGLFPDDPLAPMWFNKMRLFAINSYSHTNDSKDESVIDPGYNLEKVMDLHIGPNLYDDYTLQNHNYFHTSYQNVVMQELGEAALALELFQAGEKRKHFWKTTALMHNCEVVFDRVLAWLALADAELAMPNGNDWSMFLYDQITSYTTLACFLRDPDALLLENIAYQQIKARQTTTEDGSWLLRPDVQARRMGVQAHRIMMTFLMHLVKPTKDLIPTRWDAFRTRHSKALLFPSQNIARAYTKERFTTFSWSEGLKSYTGYFTSDKVDKNKIVVPYRKHNTGNILGWYNVAGKKVNARPMGKGKFYFQGDGYVMNGGLNTNDSTLNNRFSLYSTPRNAFIYLDYVTANDSCLITAEKGGLLAISTDEFTKDTRTLYYHERGLGNNDESIKVVQSDGEDMVLLNSDWVNIDNEIGVIGQNEKMIAFGDKSTENSIKTTKLYPMYSNDTRTVGKGEVIGKRNLVYYANVSAIDMCLMSQRLCPLKQQLPDGWNGIIAPDSCGAYLFISNFDGRTTEDALEDVQYPLTKDGEDWEMWAPVFNVETYIADSHSTAAFTLEQNRSFAQPINFFIKGDNVIAFSASETIAYVTARKNTTITMAVCVDNMEELVIKNVKLKAGQTVVVLVKDGDFVVV